MSSYLYADQWRGNRKVHLKLIISENSQQIGFSGPTVNHQQLIIFRETTIFQVQIFQVQTNFQCI
jgi:hypothetical protein